IILDIGNASLAANNIDLKNAKIDLATFELENSGIGYFQNLQVPTDSLAVNPALAAAKLDSAAEKHQGQPIDWVVTLNDLNLKNTSLDFGNFDQPETNKGMDFNHLKFTGINVELEDLYYSQERISAALQQLQLQEKSGFKITNFQADVNAESKQSSLKNVDLKSGHSHLPPVFSLG